MPIGMMNMLATLCCSPMCTVIQQHYEIRNYYQNTGKADAGVIQNLIVHSHTMRFGSPTKVGGKKHAQVLQYLNVHSLLAGNILLSGSAWHEVALCGGSYWIPLSIWRLC